MLNKFKKSIQKIDFFYSSQMLKLQDQRQYRTFTGGFMSLGLIIIILLSFSTMFIQTFQRTTISYTVSSKVQTHPDPITFSTKQKKFMLAVASPSFDFRSVNRLLDPCTQDHFHSSLWPNTTQYAKIKDTETDPATWLCMPKQLDFNIFGVTGDVIYNSLNIQILPCDSSLQSQLYNPLMVSTCTYNPGLLNSLAGNKITIKYVDYIVNPDDLKAVVPYFNSVPYLSIQIGKSVKLQKDIKSFQINTDTQILPYQLLESQSGYLVSQCQTLRYVDHPGSFNYQFIFMRSKGSLVYTRQVQKISTVFSYVGGLIGAILAILFFINAYNSFSLQICISSQVFKQRQQDQQNMQNLKNKIKYIKQTNIFQYIMYNIYCFMTDYIKKTPNWPKYAYMHSYLKQINHQLDVRALIQRLIFLEHCVDHLFQDFHFDILQQNKPDNPTLIKKIRQKFSNIVDHEYQKLLNSQLKNQSNLSNKPIINDDINKTRNQYPKSKKQFLKTRKISKTNEFCLSLKQGDIISKRIVEKLKQRKLNIIPTILQSEQSNINVVPVKFEIVDIQNDFPCDK